MDSETLTIIKFEHVCAKSSVFKHEVPQGTYGQARKEYTVSAQSIGKNWTQRYALQPDLYGGCCE